MSFFSKLEARVDLVNSLLCVGLDPHFKELFPSTVKPEDVSEEEKCDAAFTFCKTLIDATAPFAAAFKPNAAFFEALGPNLGMLTLRRVIDAIPPSIPVLLDVKRGDIGTTAQAYAEACYERNSAHGLGADAVTLSPLMGYDSILPFISGKYTDRGAFLLCKTSNPGSNDLLTLNTTTNNIQTPLFEIIAKMATVWADRAIFEATGTRPRTDGETSYHRKTPGLGLVVGATDTQALRRTRAMIGEEMWILAPGVGVQGASLNDACIAGLNSKGSGLLIPVSRGISLAENPAMAAKTLQLTINAVRQDIISKYGNIDAAIKTSHLDETNTASLLTPNQYDFIDFCLNQGVLKFGSFILKSGRTSPYFFNAGLFSSGQSLYRLGQAYASAIMTCPQL
jgi:uridine monophosphate synthetase